MKTIKTIVISLSTTIAAHAFYYHPALLIFIAYFGFGAYTASGWYRGFNKKWEKKTGYKFFTSWEFSPYMMMSVLLPFLPLMMEPSTVFRTIKQDILGSKEIKFHWPLEIVETKE